MTLARSQLEIRHRSVWVLVPEINRLELYIDTEKEPFVLKRLYREGKGGNVSQTGTNTFTYTTQVFDVNEMLPWIRTFTGRIIKLETSHPGLKSLFMRDMEEMYKMYDIKK